MKQYKTLKSTAVYIALLIITLQFSAIAQPQRPTPVVSPDVQTDNSVIFRLRAPEAMSVKLGGTMNEGYAQLDMTKNDEGIFEIKIGPLEPDMYVYTYNVDGVKTLDPSNNVVVRDGSNIESRLMIPGELTDLFDSKDVAHGNVTSVWYPSPVFGIARRMIVYTPPGYEESSKSYPVLYLLHGGGSDEEAWTSRGRANYILDNLIAQRKAEPMIVVMPNGSIGHPAAPNERSYSADTQTTSAMDFNSMNSGKYEESLANDIIPFIEKNYKVIKDADHRALAGLSMGGLHVTNSFMANPDMFAYINVMSSGWFISDKEMYENGDKKLAEIAPTFTKTVKYLRFTQGGPEDIAYKNGLEMLKVFDKNNIKYEFSEMPGGHSWNVWRKDLKDFAPKLFK